MEETTNKTTWLVKLFSYDDTADYPYTDFFLCDIKVALSKDSAIEFLKNNGYHWNNKDGMYKKNKDEFATLEICDLID